MKPEYSKQKLENLVMEIISFLQKWGLWQETTIFANGNRYAHTYEKEKMYKGLSFVEFMPDVNPETYTRGITASCDCDGQHVWKSFSNSEHIFDMVFEGPLYMLLRHGKYEVKKSDVSEEAWTYIFEHTDILEEYFLEKYGVLDVADLLEQILMGQFEKSEYSTWNPLVFDTWEEYLAFCGDEECVVNYHRNDTFAEGSEDLEVPATLYHLFEKDGLGKYFLNESGEVDTEALVFWIKREHLEMGFAKDEINQNHVLPLISGLHPGDAKWLTDESEIKDALTYMINFLEKRQRELEEKCI